MGGEIGLDSSIGGGTTAHFTIPFHKPQYALEDNSLDIESIPDRLQSDVSVSCRSSEAGISTPPDSPMDPNGISHPQRLLKRISRGALGGEELSVEERRKRHVLVVEDSMFSLILATL
jgi:hypothetical protein